MKSLIVSTCGYLLSDRVFGLDLQLVADALIVMLAVFLLFLMMSYLLFNPARDLLRKRQEKIQGDLDQAEADRREAKETKELYEAKLQDADKEAQEILADSRRRALIHRDEVVAEAKAEAGRIVDRAEREAQLEKEKVKDEVKQEIVQVATSMAGKFVAASLDGKSQDALIDETLQELGEETWRE